MYAFLNVAKKTKKIEYATIFILERSFVFYLTGSWLKKKQAIYNMVSWMQILLVYLLPTISTE